MQRVVALLLFFLLVFGIGFSLGVQVAPVQENVAFSFGGGALLPVVLAYLAATRTP